MQSRVAPHVDVLMLCRPHMRPPESIIQRVEQQRGVNVRLHIASGWPQRTDRNRYQTIARARNEIKQRATAPWVMFVDDDVLLEPDCVRTLVDTLARSPRLGAVAADSANEQCRVDWTGHIGMAACLFRRKVIDQIEFRSTHDECECWCCCTDLRRAGVGIIYQPRALATHLRGQAGGNVSLAGACASRPHVTQPGTILAAFDRRDVARFETTFLQSLRGWGNGGTVIAVTYGLYPSELRRIGSLPGVEVESRPANGVMAPVRRLTDFAEITRRLPAAQPTAYWDVADVIFQSSLQPLWREILSRPHQLLAVIEPKSYPNNAAIPAWSLSIRDPWHRRRAYELLQRSPFLNSGFAAGTAATMHRYFAEGARMRCGPELDGSTDWGDQMALNVYCHSHPTRWTAVNEGWNYCVHDRGPGEVVVSPDGLITSRRVGKVPVAHGNARSLRQFALIADRSGAS